jgi:peptidyl-tRNA hydrolase
VDYVLKPFAAEEIAARDAMIDKAVTAIETLIEAGAARAMQVVNAQQ